MGKLHEVLPARDELKATRQRILEETINTFKNKGHLFAGSESSYEPFDEEAREREAKSEHKALDTTAYEKLAYSLKHLAKYWDALVQVDATNQQAKASIVVNGVEILENVPTTTLLALEGELKQLRTVILGVPQLPPGKRVERDQTLGTHVWRQTDAETSFREVKAPEFQVVVEPTEHQKAIVERVDQVKNVGKYTKTFWFGAMSPVEKSEILARLDTLSRAVKAARQRANSTTVVKMSIGQVLTDYVLDGKVPTFKVNIERPTPE